MNFENLTSLYQHFDLLAETDSDADTLFASSYIRGFISLAACQFGGEEQPLTKALADDITNKLHEARTELSPQDKVYVSNYWQEISAAFTE